MACIIDLGLGNVQLYTGCEVGEVGGRQTLLTKPAEAANIIGRNATFGEVWYDDGRGNKVLIAKH